MGFGKSIYFSSDEGITWWLPGTPCNNCNGSGKLLRQMTNAEKNRIVQVKSWGVWRQGTIDELPATDDHANLLNVHVRFDELLSAWVPLKDCHVNEDCTYTDNSRGMACR